MERELKFKELNKLGPNITARMFHLSPIGFSDIIA